MIVDEDMSIINKKRNGIREEKGRNH